MKVVKHGQERTRRSTGSPGRTKGRAGASGKVEQGTTNGIGAKGRTGAMEQGMPNANAIIEKLILDIGGTKIELTLNQAKKLQGALDELFREKVVNVPQPYPVPSAPIIIEPSPWRWPCPWRRRRAPWLEEFICKSGATARYDASARTATLAVA